MILSDAHYTVPKFCGCQTGLFFVRRCGKPAVSQCGRCGLEVCGEHAVHLEEQAGQVLCPNCQAALEGQGGASFNGRQGGVFSRDSGGYPGDRDGPAFAEEDYAAFDALSDFDRTAEDGHAYDS